MASMAKGSMMFVTEVLGMRMLRSCAEDWDVILLEQEGLVHRELPGFNFH